MMNTWQETFNLIKKKNWEDNKDEYQEWLELQLDTYLDMMLNTTDIKEMQKVMRKACADRKDQQQGSDIKPTDQAGDKIIPLSENKK